MLFLSQDKSLVIPSLFFLDILNLSNYVKGFWFYIKVFKFGLIGSPFPPNRKKLQSHIKISIARCPQNLLTTNWFHMVFLLVDRKSPNYYKNNNPTKSIKLNGW